MTSDCATEFGLTATGSTATGLKATVAELTVAAENATNATYATDAAVAEANATTAAENATDATTYATEATGDGRHLPSDLHTDDIVLPVRSMTLRRFQTLPLTESHKRKAGDDAKL